MIKVVTPCFLYPHRSLKYHIRSIVNRRNPPIQIPSSGTLSCHEKISLLAVYAISETFLKKRWLVPSFPFNPSTEHLINFRKFAVIITRNIGGVSVCMRWSEVISRRSASGQMHGFSISNSDLWYPLEIGIKFENTPFSERADTPIVNWYMYGLILIMSAKGSVVRRWPI